MCTVVFIPANKKYFFASLRDESPKRPLALAPDIYGSGRQSFLSPTDTLAGGTWIGVTASGDTIILLNGGFENHQKRKDYRKSRGLIVSELLFSAMPVVDWSIMDLENTQPFTLIVWSGESLFQLVWDGDKKHRAKLDAGLPYIWSSVTLYNAAARAKRTGLFNNWIACDPIISKLSILDFFKSFPDKENGFIMNRNEQIKTLSYSFIELNQNATAEMNYYDFLNFTYSSKTIRLEKDAQCCILPNLMG